jgi:hypothetical protein
LIFVKVGPPSSQRLRGHQKPDGWHPTVSVALRVMLCVIELTSAALTRSRLGQAVGEARSKKVQQQNLKKSVR